MTIIDFLAYTGIFIFSITGALKARTHQMDIFGGAVLAFATAYGGGTLRDLLIGVRPVNWVNDYTGLVLVGTAVIFTFLLRKNANRFKRTIFFTDAVGLGLFTAAGIERSLAMGINDGYAIVMGVITATFGGLIADVISNTVPNLLKRGELYATACAIGGTIYILLDRTTLSNDIRLIICIVLVVGIRIYSKRKMLSLPQI